MMENIQRNYNIHANVAHTVYDNDRYKYEINYDNIYIPNKDYQANYNTVPSVLSPAYSTNGIPMAKTSHDLQYGAASDAEYSDSQMTTPRTHFLYDNQQSLHMGSKNDLPYISRDRISSTVCSPTPRESHYGMKSPVLYSGAESMHSVHSILQKEYQVS